MRLLVLFFAFFACLAAANPQQEAPQVPNVYKAIPSDVATPDAVVRALYSAISGPAGKRDWDRFRNLFDPKAVMSLIYKARGGELHHITFSTDYYVQLNAPYLEKNSFYERESKRVIEQHGQMAEVLSTSLCRHSKSEAPFKTDVNSFLLYQDNGRWWILSAMWEDAETAGAKEFR